MSLKGLDDLEKLAINYKNKPTDLEFIYYWFWRKDMGLKEFNLLPLPYIFGIINTYTYMKQLEEKEMKKAQRKK